MFEPLPERIGADLAAESHVGPQRGGGQALLAPPPPIVSVMKRSAFRRPPGDGGPGESPPSSRRGRCCRRSPARRPRKTVSSSMGRRTPLREPRTGSRRRPAQKLCTRHFCARARWLASLLSVYGPQRLRSRFLTARAAGVFLDGVEIDDSHPCRGPQMRCLAPKAFSRLLMPAIVLSALGSRTALLRDAAAQGLEQVKARYTKYEYRIPMRDGKRLFTAVYAPKDQSQRYPILLTRTPYSVQTLRGRSVQERSGPVAAGGQGGLHLRLPGRARAVDVGGGIRQHAPVPARQEGPTDVDESSDTWDTIQWLIKHVENHNGKVGMWGISYPGFYASMGMIDAHPALKAVSPQAPIADWFIGDDWHHHGALMLPHAFNFMAVFGRPRPQPIEEVAVHVRSRDARRLPVLPARWGRWPTPTPGSSRTTFPSGTKSCAMASMTISGRRGTSARI